MAPRKTERILNLTICLLVSGRYLPKSRIREAVEGYHNLSDAAFERTFERDKDELRWGCRSRSAASTRSLMTSPGIGSCPRSLHYRPSTWTLRKPPSWELPRESGGTRAWPRRQGAPSPSCVRRAWNRMPRSLLPWSHPFGHRSRALRCCAVLDARVSFTYRDGNPRTLEPWGLTSFKGRWYVIGRDVDRAATRMFKLSRMADLPKRVPEPGRMRCRPTSTCRLARSLAPREPTETAVLAIRAGKAPGLARRGEPATTNVKLPAGFAVHVVGFGDLHSAAEEITQYAADVVVLEPAELRELVVRGLTAVAESVTAA